MAYRLLLPSSEVIYPKQVEEALDQFDVFRTGDLAPTWSICDLAVEVSDAQAHRLTLRLLRDDVVERQEEERHFMRPQGARVWLELRCPGASDNRNSRLAARLCAMSIATRMGLPVLETRNGVFCRSAEAFTAWCSRTSHPDTILLGEKEHVTMPKNVRPGVRRPKGGPLAKVATAVQSAPLPEVGVATRLWRKWRNLRTYIVTIPTTASSVVVRALTKEITSTFGDSNVIYQEDNNRLLVVAKDSPGTGEVISYYRRRAHPERLRLADAPR